MSEDEGKRALDRLKATRAGHRGVATKLLKSIDELLHDPKTDQPRCETLYELLKAKSKTLSTLDDQILERIEIEAIETEIEESSEVTRIINAQKTLKLFFENKLTKPITVTKTNDGNSTTTKEVTTKETQMLPIQRVLHRQPRKSREKMPTPRLQRMQQRTQTRISLIHKMMADQYLQQLNIRNLDYRN